MPEMNVLLLGNVTSEVACHCTHCFLCNNAQLSFVQICQAMFAFAILVVRHFNYRKPRIALQIAVRSCNCRQQCSRATEPFATPSTKYATKHISSTRSLNRVHQQHFNILFGIEICVYLSAHLWYAPLFLGSHVCNKHCFSSAHLSAILHRPSFAIRVLQMPMVLHSAKNELDIFSTLTFETRAFVVHLSHKFFVFRVSP